MRRRSFSRTMVLPRLFRRSWREMLPMTRLVARSMTGRLTGAAAGAVGVGEDGGVEGGGVDVGCGHEVSDHGDLEGVDAVLAGEVIAAAMQLLRKDGARHKQR